MSDEPRVELVRQAFEAWEQGDVEATLAVFDPEIEVFAPPEIGNPGTFHGIDGFMSWATAWLEVWDSFSQELASIEPVGERHVLVDSHQSGRGKGSGVKVELDVTYVYEIRNGLGVYLGIYRNHDDALADARAREARD